MTTPKLGGFLNVNSDALKQAAKEADDIATALHTAVLNNWANMVPTQPAGMDQGSVLVMKNCNEFADKAKLAIADIVNQLGDYSKTLREAADSYSGTDFLNSQNF
ncbi:PE domain-containing protein [Mycobacterium sp.]|uniref:PE domain-containing protein n=1 Tax=Mycobacterium sp. TaxID=1785 RepID=UPI003BAB77FC